jgi:shikimate dehydrogenase
MAKYGLIGKNIEYSFSKTFFTLKFEQDKRKDTFHNFDIANISQLIDILKKNKDLKGLNVTIPFKESVIPLLDKIDKEAKTIGAVNTIKINKDGKIEGYNTDHYGFAHALVEFFPIKERKALILGSGGASKAVKYVLKMMDFKITQVSRNEIGEIISYKDLNHQIMSNNFLMINCTPIGTFPNIHDFPDIPYEYLTKDHLVFDLTYNPRETQFMIKSKKNGARVSNGLKMLEYQAKRSLYIWDS